MRASSAGDMAEVPPTFIGFGEAGQAFADGLPGVRSYGRKIAATVTRNAMLAIIARFGATAFDENAAAVADAPLILSLVTADEALAAADETAHTIAQGALFCDMNSVAPETKRAAAQAIEAAGGRYVDVAVMAPVHPQRRAVPLLVSGPHVAAGEVALRAMGFTNIRTLAGPIGTASMVKMIRSAMIKGIEALSAECFIAAEAAGVLGEVIASLDASWPGSDWAARADHNLDRMLVHGVRRAAEMEEVVRTLDALGTGSVMSRGTAERQRALGRIGEGTPWGLHAKLALAAGEGRAKAA